MARTRAVRVCSGIVSSRAFVGWVSVGLLAIACATPPQEESTALADPEPPPQPAEPVETPESDPMPVIAEPASLREPSAPAEPTPAAITKIPVCDEYLSLYQRCETYLKPQIMAGDRRFYAAEVASLQYFLGTPEAAALPESCRAMLDALRVDCPPQHRQPPPEPSP
jgi:hypothetical protein